MRIDRPREDGRPEPDVPDPGDAPKTGDLPDDRRRTPEVSEAPDIPDRVAYFAEYREKVDATYRAHAVDQGCDRVREVEETVVTPAMRRIESADPERFLVGLDHRLKGRDRLSEKVQEAMRFKGRTASEAFAEVKDAIRYTFVYQENRYKDGVLADCERLKAEGFEPVDRKNSWPAEEYKGINSRWRVPGNGQLFEVQFHTEVSFATKQETHAAYERLRSGQATDVEREELKAYQRRVSSMITIPPGATEIEDYRPERV